MDKNMSFLTTFFLNNILGKIAVLYKREKTHRDMLLLEK